MVVSIPIRAGSASGFIMKDIKSNKIYPHVITTSGNEGFSPVLWYTGKGFAVMESGRSHTEIGIEIER